MKATINYNNNDYQINLNAPIDISIPLKNGEENPNAWWATHPIFEPVISGNFIGSTKKGSPVNFYNVKFNPHGNGTHTECVGHISKENHTINKCLKTFWFKAELISILPTKKENGDLIITLESVKTALENKLDFEALIIRTLPNQNEKLTKVYGSTNPPFIDKNAMQFIVEKGVKHFVIDLPSVDREEDKGELLSHHVFWNYPAFGTNASEADLKKVRTASTITEMVFVPNEIKDGSYFINFAIASFELDASPSKIILYELD